MKGSVKKRKFPLNLFPQHIIPDELSLLSVYEIVVYFGIFVFCYICYTDWNRVPIIEKDVYLENTGSDSSANHPATTASFHYYIPNSDVFSDSIPHVLYDFVNDESHVRPSIDSIFIDSIKNHLLDLKPDTSRLFGGNLYYCRIDGPATRLDWRSLEEKYKRPECVMDTTFGPNNCYFGYAFNRYVEGPPVHIINETFIAGDGYGTSSMDLNDKDLLKPGFFSRRDISQSYFQIRFHTHSIDTIKVYFHFKGVVDFSPMGDYSPSEALGDKIIYTIIPVFEKPASDPNLVVANKVMHDRFFKSEDFVYTVQFHAKYKDMENSQARRVFLISAVLSALITIFLGFIIILVYRIFRNEKSGND